MLTSKLEKKIFTALQQIEYSSLLKGDMGVCIFFYVIGNENSNPQYIKIGDNILKKVLKEIHENKKIDIETGITGIGLGISYLIKKKYVEGNINEILKDIDIYIYQQMCLIQESNQPCIYNNYLLDILIYFLCRYKEITSISLKLILEKCIIDLFNSIYIKRSDTFYNEPYPFSLKYDICIYLYLLTEIYKLGIERERILHILEEMKYFLFSQTPVLQSNRLTLMVATSIVHHVTGDKDWLQFSSRLARDLDLKYIFTKEILDKNIFPVNGIIAIWLLINMYNKINNTRNINLDSHYIKQRIINSSFWNRLEYDKELLKRHYSIDGYCGIKLFINHLSNKSL